MFIQLLADNPDSWIVPYAEVLRNELLSKGYQCVLLHKHSEVKQGDVLALLSCERKFDQLKLNRYNLVIHESDLPRGKGWSPLTWQILEGRKEIPVTLFEATEEIDAGPIYLQKYITLEGHELNEEIKHMQGIATLELIYEFISNHKTIKGKPQEGESTYYPRRKSEDSRLDPEKSIAEQFNLLRVCDNKRYPAWFELNGVKYSIKINKI